MFDRSTPYASGHMYSPVGDQQIYFEEHGTPDGLPALYLHGGPGGGLSKRGWTKLFDPEVWRLIGMDQRGCGQSSPLATDPAHDWDANTTQQLIADIEQLREHLGIDRWTVYGVSWGTALGLAYARTHPDRVSALVLVAIAPCSRETIDWLADGVKTIYPEAWHTLAARVGYDPASGKRIIDHVAELVRNPDHAVRTNAINAWNAWEEAHVQVGYRAIVMPAGEYEEISAADERANVVSLTTHYFARDCFFGPEFLPVDADLSGTEHIPTWLFHGRLDVSGPASGAFRVADLMPHAKLTIVEDEGHGGPKLMSLAADAIAHIAAETGTIEP